MEDNSDDESQHLLNSQDRSQTLSETASREYGTTDRSGGELPDGSTGELATHVCDTCTRIQGYGEAQRVSVASVLDEVNLREYSSPVQHLLQHITPTEVQPSIFVYGQRWYVLFIFSLLNFLQGSLNDSWPVIAESAEAAFGWTDKDVSLLQVWFYVTYMLALISTCWLIIAKGFRPAMVCCVTLVLMGTLCRIVSVTPPTVTWMAHIGNILIGLAGPVVTISGPVLSNLWFPPQERIRATAVMTISGFAGPSFGYLLGPLLVPLPSSSYESPSNYTNLDSVKNSILIVRHIEAICCAIVFVAILLHFPSRPTKPPCLSALVHRLDLATATGQLFKKDNAQFWLLVLVYTLTSGVYEAWGALLDINLKPLGISQVKAGLLGSLADLLGSVAAVLAGSIADHFGHMKMMCMVLLSAATLSTFWFVLLVERYIPFSSWQLTAASTTQGIFLNAPVPLYYELAIEHLYPLEEVVISGVMSLGYCFLPLAFLLFFWLPHAGIHWMNWFMYASLVVAAPILLGFSERYRRLQVDQLHREIIIQQSDVGSINDEVFTTANNQQ